VPATESLKDTIARVLPAYEELIVPALKAGETVIVSAHGNSLRAWSSTCRAFPMPISPAWKSHRPADRL
jgi:bisphosphoglycerate-dependent phosphoglycerate mutase